MIPGQRDVTYSYVVMRSLLKSVAVLSIFTDFTCSGNHFQNVHGCIVGDVGAIKQGQMATDHE